MAKKDEVVEEVVEEATEKAEEVKVVKKPTLAELTATSRVAYQNAQAIKEEQQLKALQAKLQASKK